MSVNKFVIPVTSMKCALWFAITGLGIVRGLPIASSGADRNISNGAASDGGAGVSEFESGFLCLGFAAESGFAGKFRNRPIFGARRKRRIA
jgi:hypothetical protein